jgi:hypothetical protein
VVTGAVVAAAWLRLRSLVYGGLEDIRLLEYPANHGKTLENERPSRPTRNARPTSYNTVPAYTRRK